MVFSCAVEVPVREASDVAMNDNNPFRDFGR